MKATRRHKMDAIALQKRKAEIEAAETPPTTKTPAAATTTTTATPAATAPTLLAAATPTT